MPGTLTELAAGSGVAGALPARSDAATVEPSAAPGSGRPARRGTLRHWMAGWRDGRSCRPSLEPGAAVPDRLLLLVSDAARTVEQHWAALLIQTRPGRLEIAALPDEIRRAEARRDGALAELAQHRAAGPDLTRRFGEAQLPAELVRSRRKREHARRTAELTEARDTRTNYVHMKVQRQRELGQHLVVALEAAKAAARADLTGYDARAAAYVRGALRTHFDPNGLALQAHRFTIPRAEWLRLADPEDLLRAAGAESDRP